VEVEARKRMRTHTCQSEMERENATQGCQADVSKVVLFSNSEPLCQFFTFLVSVVLRIPKCMVKSVSNVFLSVKFQPILFQSVNEST
jgi:hypothetical protein